MRRTGIAPAAEKPPPSMILLDEVSRTIAACERCPELRAYGAGVARAKRRAFSDQTYWGKPVPAFGDPAARIMLVGLAPGAHGSHRTGRMFTGDASGDFLYPALFRAGLASQAQSTGAHDGLQLTNCIITSAGRCAPPDNKPTREQLAKCHPYLIDEFDALPNLAVLVALGGIGFDAILALLRARSFAFDRRAAVFGHAHEFSATAAERTISVLSCYHPSRQNTNTKRLTAPMIDAVFTRAVALAG